MEFSNMHAQAHGGMNMNLIKKQSADKFKNLDQDRYNSNKLMSFASGKEEIKIEADDYQQQRSFRESGLLKKAVDPRIRLIQENGNGKNKDLSTNSQSANHSPRQGLKFNNPANKSNNIEKPAARNNVEDSVMEEAEENFASQSVRSLVENNNSSSSSDAYLPLHQLSSLGSSQNSVVSYN